MVYLCIFSLIIFFFDVVKRSVIILIYCLLTLNA